MSHPLQKLLQDYGIRQKDLPKRLREISNGQVSIGPTAVSNWLAGRNAISPEIRPFLAKLFDVPEETFAPPLAPRSEHSDAEVPLLGERLEVDGQVLPSLEIDLSVREWTPGSPPEYKTRFMVQIESVNGEPYLIARELQGRDPQNLRVEIAGKQTKLAGIEDRVDAVVLGKLSDIVTKKNIDEAPGAALLVRVPLRAGVIRKWLNRLLDNNGEASQGGQDKKETVPGRTKRCT